MSDVSIMLVYCAHCFDYKFMFSFVIGIVFNFNLQMKEVSARCFKHLHVCCVLHDHFFFFL